MLGIGVPSQARGAESQSLRMAAQAEVPLAIADLDGDKRPDMALVEAWQKDSGSNDYWVQLRLSTRGNTAIRVVAPLGGLLIEARDVNGDHAVDLILATAWRRDPVAVLLNDGHGRFVKVEPAEYPAAFSKRPQSWSLPSGFVSGVFAGPSQPRSGCDAGMASLRAADTSPGVIFSPSFAFAARPALAPDAGRAPPATSSLSV